MGRKRRKIIKKKVVKPPPKVFLCPICNEEAVTVRREEDGEYAQVVCARCGANARVKWHPAYTSVDAYAEFYDIVTGAKKPLEVTVEAGGGSEVPEEASLTPHESELEEALKEEAREAESEVREEFRMDEGARGSEGGEDASKNRED